MKNYLHILLISFMLIGSAAYSQTPQFTFTNLATGGNSIPWGGGSWADQRNQWLYPPGDFGGTVYNGIITKIYLRASAAYAATTFTNCVIRLGQPPVTTGLTTTWETAMTTVLTSASLAIPAGVASQWILITLQSPFLYDPTKPLVVETIQTGTSGAITLLAGGTPLNVAYTGNTQTYGASAAASGTTRRYSYAFGFDLIPSSRLNDAGILSINRPTGLMTPGIDTVKGTLKNYGKTNLVSTNLRWSVNGVNQPNPASWSGLLPTNATTGPLTFGAYNFTPGVYTIKTWTNTANSVLDSNAFNDSAMLTIYSCNPANGTYIIDPTGAGDFKTFKVALEWIKNCGISGPVTFRAKAGTYNEQLTIPVISGSSATNTITFQSYDLDSTKVNLTYAATGTADNWVVRLNGCDYVKFKKMTITAAGASYGNVFEFIASADNNTLEGNIIKTLITTSSSFSCIYSGTSLDQYNTIKNNIISGGYYGIYWYGASTASLELGNVIEGNTIKDFYYYGINGYYQNALKIRQNSITPSSTSGVVYGISATYCNNDIQFTQNYLQLPATSTIYGMYLSSCAGTAILRGNISNNFISTLGTSVGTVAGIYCTTVSYQDINYNSVCISNVSATTGYAFYITSGTAATVSVQNNNFVNLGNGFSIYAATTTTSLGTCNYNNLYTTGLTLCYYAANQATLAAWRTASAKDANSVNVNPGYISNIDLHVNSASISGKGITIAGFTVDIDGETRLNPPDIGADEYNLVANDAGITAMTAPTSPCAGSNTITVKVKNYGSSTLTSVIVNWSVNGLTQTPFSISTLSLAQYQETTFNIGSYSFVQGIPYNVKFWPTMPNGFTDGNARNDTILYKNLTTSMAGIYTIGGAGANYPNILMAVADIQAKGMCAPVTFKIAKGVYPGRVVISPITGASAINRVTFDGRYSDSVKITYAGITPNAATILLNGADYITVKNMTIENTGATYGVGVCLKGIADYNTVDSCKIIVDTVGTSSYVIPIQSSGTEISYSTASNSSNYTTISNCLLKGGYMGVVFYGTSYTVKCISNSIINCVFSKQYNYGVYSYYQANPTYRNNLISGFRSASPYGIMNYYASSSPNLSYNTILGVYYGIYNYGYSGGPCDNPQIIGNIIRSSYYGIYCYYSTSSNIERNDIVSGYMGLYLAYETNPLDSSIIINNMVRMGGNISYPYSNAFYLVYAAKVSVYHNTFQTDSTYSSPTGYGTCYVRYASGFIKLKNNVFRSMGNMPCFNTDGLNIATNDLDYNIYFTQVNGNMIAYWGTTSYTSFTVWKSSMPNFNKNSLNVDPQLVSKYNLHLKLGTTFNRGIPLGIDKDIDKDDRCIPMPTIGADEFIHPYNKPNADFSSDTMACLSSPYTFLNKAGLYEAKRHFWYINNQFKSNAINFTYDFKTPGLNTVTLITQNCSTTDTVIKTLNIGMPTKAPVSYFVVNKNKVEVNEQVSLSDLSASCPEHWKWTVVPDSFFDPLYGHNMCTYNQTPGADTTQSPQISFNYSGVYSICLQTSNSINTGSTYCLNKYIEVIPAVKLCYAPFETKEYAGSLYDDGGNIGQYSPSKNCGFSIHPCTKSVSLVFSSFDIVQGDYIKIYDGRDNKATPMWNPVLYPDGINNIYAPPSSTDTFEAKSGAMYIEIITDGSSQGNGINARWFSSPETYAATKASFVIPDTICNGVATTFYNTSTGVQNDNFWDFESDGVIDASTLHGFKSYAPDGNYNCKLTVKGCGGIDSFAKNVYVKTILAKPQFELLTNNSRPKAFSEAITVSQNSLKNCIDSTIWDISPKSYTLLSGSLNGNASISLKFNDTVCYSFNIIGKYHGYSDTNYYPCFIHPVNYCTPFVAYLSADIGISRVRINTIDKSSDIGSSAYSDFTGSISTDLERGSMYSITLNRLTSSNPMNRKVWIDYNHDGAFDNKTEMVASEPSAFTLNWTGYFDLPSNLALGAVRMRVAASLGNSANNPCGPSSYGEYEDYNLNIVRDKTKPVMSIVGPPVMHIQECTRGYSDPGVVVTDNADTNIGNSVVVTGSVNPFLAGTYIVTYNVTDNAGNVAIPITRTVIVDKELVPPVISLVGNPMQIVQLFNSYSDSGYVAFDTCSGLNNVVKTTDLDTANIGTYYCKYTAFDKNGNYAEVSRTIYVMDTIDPVISSISDDTILLNIYNILPNPLYTLYDNYYAYYDIKVKIKGTYYQTFTNGEATIPGFYTFMYVATDGSGNSDSISFVINVLDQVKPVLQLLGDIYYTICRFDTLVDPGYTIKDNYDKNPKLVKSGTYITNYLPQRLVGNYELVYTATDNSGNRAVNSRFITVSDQGACFNSINQSDKSNGISLYPNPGNGKFNIEFNTASKGLVGITIYNALGNTVYHSEEQINSDHIKIIDNRDMKPGVYFIQVSQGDKITNIKYNLMK